MTAAFVRPKRAVKAFFCARRGVSAFWDGVGNPGVSESFKNRRIGVLVHPAFNRVKWGDLELSAAEVCSAAIQHEGMHQGQCRPEARRTLCTPPMENGWIDYSD